MDQALTLWIEEVKRFNGRLHLVSPSLEATLHEQVRDTMDLLGSVREGRIADLGSGSGFLGIPYKVMNPEAKVSLIERSGKKCLFLRHVIDRLGLKDIDVVEADPLKRPVGPFPALMSRSFSPRESLVKAVLSCLSLPGRFCYIQTGDPEEISHPQFSLKERVTREYGGYRLNLDTYLVTSR
ncbi:MAG TPA: class I SAM-dependent methyltransferase [Deltaproteobacteria bacterium]|jgi:16S rRNA (guanine527-N7)-methyltransferase|nr:class I SAM-dependent methyltransferase [Deltaproteobacteria bacterium]HOI05789.1 class I SAM-dependent methyltransferase [Deltaproteobacteria bacterium]